MNIKVAKYAGACFGVNRSLELLLDAVNTYPRVATLGDIIHNPQTVNQLKSEHGVIVVDSPAQAVERGVDAVVIRSHGVLVSVEQQLKECGIHVIDATCPHVKHVQQTAFELAKKYGAVLIVGKSGHPEVDGVLSYVQLAGATGFIANSQEELSEQLLPLSKFSDGFGVVCQTTQSIATFENIVAILQQNDLRFEVENTICKATQNRQSSAQEASKTADVVIVLGGLNSSNTTHLRELCQKNCSRVFHIQDPQDVSGVDFSNAEEVLICAGASTPKSQIATLKNLLEEL